MSIRRLSETTSTKFIVDWESETSSDTEFTIDETPSFETPSCRLSEVKIYSARDVTFYCKGSACRTQSEAARVLSETIKKIQEFFSIQYGICGIDGKGLLPKFTIEWDKDNAQWQCKADRCDWLFHNRFALMPVVICHEYVHGVMHYFGKLGSTLEARALDESLADVFAIAFMHYQDQGERDNWSVGGIRDLSHGIIRYDPTLVKEEHDASVVPSHAFYYLVKKSGRPSFELASIWLDAVNRPAKTLDSFYDFARETVKKTTVRALSLRDFVKDAWDHVGIKV